MLRTSLCAGIAVAALAGTAYAENPSATSKPLPGEWFGTGRLRFVVLPDVDVLPAADISNVIYMNRCTGGCTVMGGQINDARNHIAAYLAPGTYQIDEYQNNAGQTGTAADDEWNQLVQCVREMYSPFNVVVTDVKPVTGNYSEAIVGGVAADVGMDPGVGGVAALSCAPRDNALSFTFANSTFYFGDVQRRIWTVCGVVGQETAHNFALDHAYEFTDGTSTCNDPMTYRGDCGGQQFFRNKFAKCGEFEPRDCLSGALCGTGGTSQNSHQKLLNIFGAGQSLIPAPTVVINTPVNNGTAMDQQVVAFQAGSKRGVEKSVLYLNGWKWAEVKGAAFGPNGQTNPSNYSVRFPTGVPNGVIDIVVESFDDLGISTKSSTVTVTKGAPCTSADACLEGQKCEAGKCFWDPPVGQLGDACTYPQYCESEMCVETTDGGYCSKECIIGATDSCPMGFECVSAGSSGACLPADTGGGCCSAGGGNALWAHGGLSLLVLGLVVRRRRRKHDRL